MLRPEINWFFLNFVHLACISNYTQLSFQFIPSPPAAGDQNVPLIEAHIPSSEGSWDAAVIFEGAETRTYHPDSFGITT